MEVDDKGSVGESEEISFGRMDVAREAISESQITGFVRVRRDDESIEEGFGIDDRESLSLDPSFRAPEEATEARRGPEPHSRGVVLLVKKDEGKLVAAPFDELGDRLGLLRVSKPQTLPAVSRDIESELRMLSPRFNSPFSTPRLLPNEK